MEQYAAFFEANRQGWNLRTEVHRTSDFYNVEQWKQGGSSLTDLETREVGPVAGKNLLHLMCHFGQDTLSFARLGARVTGCDLSEQAIDTARTLAQETGLDGRFVCCNVYDLPQHLNDRFDIVFSSFGVIGWLPELEPWARVVDHFLKPGGFFYLAEFHPVVWMFDDGFERITYPYHNAGVIETDNAGTYADRTAAVQYKDYGWNHSLSEVVMALLHRGLQLEFLHEFPYSPHDCFQKSVKGSDGHFRIQGLEDKIPMVYSLKVKKPA